MLPVTPYAGANWTNGENRPGCKSGEISKQLDIPNPTVKRILAGLLKQKLIQKHGVGPGTNNTIP
jgi:Mn-dependent DtxR family transcriptional regulator